jgi:beta-lactam-binding protein with PASTA domain
MSDFLSNFSPENYDGKKKENPPQPNAKATDDAVSSEDEIGKSPENGERDQSTVLEEVTSSRTRKSKDSTKQTVSRFGKEETEFDPTYRNRQRKKYLLITGAILALIAVISVVYYQVTHVKVPDFAGQDVSEVRTWGLEEGVGIKVDQVYDFENEVNKIVSQSADPNQKIKKGKTLTVKASLGPDPEEKIDLPDFSSLTTEEAKKWIEEQKAENISLIEQYDDKVESGKLIKQEAANKEQDIKEYKRKDRISIYYSKGKEVFEKNIEVTDFTGKSKAEAQEWAKKNELQYKEEAVFSDTVALDLVVSQEPVKGSKLAKKDQFLVKVSKGKALVVPDFSQYTIEQAEGLESKIPIQVKTVYSDQIGYGNFVSQSEEAGKEYGDTDTLPTVKVVYSLGQPYLKDIRNQATEGDLPKLFFDEYKSKGAYVYYDVYYVDSAEPKGTVVEMSRYGEFIPLEVSITIGISRGNLQGEPISSDVTAPEVLPEVQEVEKVPEAKTESSSELTEE